MAEKELPKGAKAAEGKTEDQKAKEGQTGPMIPIGFVVRCALTKTKKGP